MPHNSVPFAKKQIRYMKKSIKIFIAQLCFLFFITGGLTAFQKSEPYEDIYNYAQALYQAQALEQAETEFKRYIFMQDYSQEQGNFVTQSFCTLANIYEKQERWSLAALTIQKAINSIEQNGNEEAYADASALTDALRIQHIKYLYKSYQNSKKYLSDDLFIFSYMKLPDISDTVKQCAYSAAISNAVTNGRIEYAQKTYEEAEKLFPQSLTEQQRQAVNAGFMKLASFKPKNQKLAGYLSFIPGLGQLYAANYKDSLNAFLLNGSIIAVSVYSICTLDFWTFSLLEFDPLIRFMKGNIYNAQKDAYNYNLKKQKEFAEPILECLEPEQ